MMRAWLCVVALGAACGKQAEKKPAPAPVVEPAKPTRVEVSTKSPEARAAYDKGHELFMNQRRPEAVPHFKKALELDPSFALAMAELGLSTKGPEGVALLDKAKQLAVTEAEKTWIAAHAAMRAGDDATAIALLEKVTELAPGQWEAHYQAAVRAGANGDLDKAIKHAEQVLETDPNNAIAYNSLAYSYANARQFDKAIAAATKQVELLPNEPNPKDTLGDVLLLAGKLADAEQSFIAVTKLDPNADAAWNGIALTRAYRGDYAGAYEAYDRQAASPRADAKLEAMLDTAWIQAAEDKLPTALATLDELDKQATKSALFAYSALDRGHMLALSGKYADAKKWYEQTLARTQSLSAGQRDNVMHGYRIGVLRVAALQGKPVADADKLLAEESGPAAALAHARGLARWATSGPRAALDELAKCRLDDVRCRYDLAVATKQAGDADGSKAIMQQLAETPVRIPEGVYIKTHPVK